MQTKNLAGELIGTLRVGQIVGRRDGSPLWAAVCVRCLSTGTYEHGQLIRGDGQCKSAGCGREAVREAILDTPAKHRQRQEAAERARAKAVEAAEAAKLAEAEALYKTTNKKIGEVVRERILAQKDDEAFEDEATRGKRMTKAEADSFNVRQADSFIAHHPEYFPCAANFSTIRDYLARNGIASIVSEKTLAAAVKRLDEFGLIEHRPAQTPAPAPTLPVRVNLSIEPTTTPTGPHTTTGFDEDGRERQFTDQEISRLTAEEYRRTFRLSSSSDAEWARAWGR